MPLLIQLPRHDAVYRRHPYPDRLNVLNRKQTAIQRQLRRGGLAGYEPETLATVLTLAQQFEGKTVFYDVGAHIGLYAALVETIFGARCIAFEPTPETATISRQLRRANGLRFDIVERAISSSEGETDLYLSPKAESSNSLNVHFRPGASVITVAKTSLDRFIAGGAPIPNIIKIDVETHEAEVLRGAEHLIEQYRPYIVCEFLSGSVALDDVLKWLQSIGYSFYSVLRKTPWISLTVKEVLADASSADREWLLAPRPTTSDFYVHLETWKQLLAACDQTSNQLIPPRSQSANASSDSGVSTL